jgi:hypothetical protein
MSEEEIAYYRQRSMTERSRARVAPTPEIGRIHDQLADLYDALVAGLGGPQAANDQSWGLPAHEQERSR